MLIGSLTALLGLGLLVYVSTLHSKSRPAKRTYLKIFRKLAGNGQIKWVLQGFGECHCLRRFDCWEQARDQAEILIRQFNLKKPLGS